MTGGTLSSAEIIPLSLNSSETLSGIAFLSGGNIISRLVSYNGDGMFRRTDAPWSYEYIIYDSGNFVAGTNYVTPQTTLAGYGITDAIRIKHLDNSEVLLSNKVFSAGATNKGDFSSQNECPTYYGMYLSLQANSSKNQGFQIYGDTS